MWTEDPVSLSSDGGKERGGGRYDSDFPKKGVPRDPSMTINPITYQSPNLPIDKISMLISSATH